MRTIVALFVVLSLLSACAPTADQIQKAIAETQTAEAPPTATATEIPPTATVTPTEAPTRTPAPTRTKAPTRTPRPTNTPTIKPTATLAPTPVELSGSGYQIIDFDNPFETGVIHAVHQGGSNFVIKSLDANNEMIDLLVNTIGNYDGMRLIDPGVEDHTMRFEVKADGAWTITVYPIALEYLHILDLPGEYQSQHDDVVILRGGTPDIMEYSFDGESNAIVHAIGHSGVDYVVNEIAPVKGSTLLSGDARILDVQAVGPWTIKISTR